jgi:uncharacterized membrane protein
MLAVPVTTNAGADDTIGSLIRKTYCAPATYGSCSCRLIRLLERSRRRTPARPLIRSVCLQADRSWGEYGRSGDKNLTAFNDAFTGIAGIAARLIEIAAVFFIVVGASRAAYQSFLSLVRGATIKERKRIWVHFATWLLLGLELELAADIIRSVVAPTWQDIGKLAAIAAIRTLLNYFLGRDIAELGEGTA